MKRKEKKKIIDLSKIDKKYLNIIGIVVFVIILICASIYYLAGINREYENGDKNIAINISKATIITTIDGERKRIETDNENEKLVISIVDDVYIDIEKKTQLKEKIKNVKIEEIIVENEFEDTAKIKVIPISQNKEAEAEKKELKDNKIIYEKENIEEDEAEKMRVGFRLYHSEIMEKNVKKDEIIQYGLALIENNNDLEKYNLAKLKFKMTIKTENGEEYETYISLDKVGMEKKEFGLIKEEMIKNIKIIKKYLQK